MKTKTILLVLCFIVMGAQAFAYEPGELFEPVVDVLQHKFYYRDFRTHGLPELVDYWRPSVLCSEDLIEEEENVRNFLAMIPVSHLALLSSNTYQTLTAELNNQSINTLGFGVTNWRGNYYACSIMEEGPADLAGLQRWDRIIAIQSDPMAHSGRLDIRSDDASLPDPPVHNILCWDRTPIKFLVERDQGETYFLQVTPRPYSAYQAAGNSACAYTHNSARIGYIHFWYMHTEGIGPLLRSCIEQCKHDCQGFILDLRGRGGYSTATYEVLTALRRAKKKWNSKVAILIDQGTRSAKEILAYEIKKRKLGRLVGETTAGAVLPAGFEPIGNGKVLMFPVFSRGSYSAIPGTGMSLIDYSVLLEGKGVQPQIEAEDSNPLCPLGDPILEAALEYISPTVKTN